MARRNENECAYCAVELGLEQAFVGKDWKIYCSANCLELGEKLSIREMEQLMKVMVPSRHHYFSADLDQAARTDVLGYKRVFTLN